jgi:hypothetical protein
MAVNWNLKYRFPESTGLTSLNFTSKDIVDDNVKMLHEMGALDVTVTPLGIPAVPTPAQTEQERYDAEMRREQQELDAIRCEPLEDYNAWEENQVFLDNEGGW